MCEHPDFEARVDVNRLTADEGGPVTAYACDVHIACAVCGEPFVFIGVPVGFSPGQPMCNVDGTELRAPVRPASAPPGWGEGGPGFHMAPPDVGQARN